MFSFTLPISALAQPLWYEQNPPVVRADHLTGLSFEKFLFAGDVVTLDFEGLAGKKTWTRVGTTTINGHMVSVFNPTWNAAELREIFRSSPLDSGGRHVFGSLNGRYWLSLRTARLSQPRSQVERIDSTTQYASHVVNLVIPDFGHPTVDGFGRGFQGVTRKFYEHFPDEYDSIAVLFAEPAVMRQSGFAWLVQNPITGLGRRVFDDSVSYGSNGRLRSVQVYNGGIGNTTLWIHEIGHTWADYWDWSALAGGVEMRDSSHTPLLYPGTAVTGNWFPFQRIVRDREGGFVAELAPVRLHPTKLYRMGLIGPEAVPEMLVFEDQRQFPFAGDTIEGGYRRVDIDDIIARHGSRTGPVDETWRTAVVVVSRDRLLSEEEMSYWNFFAARQEAVTVPGYTTYAEAAQGLARLYTDVTPMSARKIVNSPPLPASLPVDRHDLPGVQLDASVPTLFTVGESLTIAGTMTMERNELRRACLQFEVHSSFTEVCGPVVGNRFAVFRRFSEADVGDYGVSLYLASSERGLSFSVGNVRVVTVGATRNRGPEPVGRLEALRIGVDGGTVTVEVSGAFRDPDGDALSYGATSWSPSVASVAVLGNTVAVTPVSEGSSTVTVTATDAAGSNGTATQAFTVTVGPAANRPPEAVGVLAPLTLGVDDAAVAVEVGVAFRDPDDDALTYGATSLAPGVASVAVVGSAVTVTAVGAGTATIDVTATDPDGLSAMQSFRVRVTAPFTDDPIVPGVTPIKAVHFTELRVRIDVLREEAGLGRFTWTDPVLQAGVTPVRRVHLLELRAALAEAYAAAGRAAPRWTDAWPAGGATPIRAVHLTELRAAVLALE